MNKSIFILLLLVLFGCEKQILETQQVPDKAETIKYISEISFNKENDSLYVYSAGEEIYFQKNELPLSKVVVIPTSVISYLDALNLTEKIIGISEPEYIYNQKIKTLIENDKLKIIGSYNELFVEEILLAKPDVVFSMSNPVLAKFHEQLKKENMKIIYIDEYKEKIPLAKSEYIKLFGLLFDKEVEAETLFEEIEESYLKTKETLSKTKDKPSVLANGMYGDVWYMPGGKSFQSVFFEDAGANYLWKNNENEGSLNLSFEEVIATANDAEIWINAGDFASLKAMLNSYKNYDWFKAFKEKKVYNWSKRSNEKGGNDYFETGVVRADWVLKDLAKIFHPDLFPEHELYFYRRLE